MANEIQPTRQDTWLINVQVEDPKTGIMLDLGTYDKLSGGVKQAQANTYRPGGLGAPISLGAKPTCTNVIVSRNARLGRDLENVQRLFNGVGSSKMIVSRQPLESEGGVPVGIKPTVYTGKLDRVQLPDIDSEGNSAALLELEMVVEGYPTT